jgi:glutamate racemase
LKELFMIGVFDSGVGGLTVLTSINQLCPDIPLMYVADHAFAPYGSLSTETLYSRSLDISYWLADHGCDLIVVACNTATALAIDKLRTELKLPIVGVEPGIKPAALKSLTQKIGILATENTVVSDRYRDLMTRFLPNVEVLSQGCAGLADAIEQDSDSVEPLLAKYVRPLLGQGIDHLVLGCTHYPLVKSQIAKLVGTSINVVDTSEAVALEVKRRYENETGNERSQQNVQLITTSNEDSFKAVIQQYELLDWLTKTEVSTLELSTF